jgi:hypothetical protein
MLGRWIAWGALVFYLVGGASTARAELLTGFDAMLALPPSDNGSSGPVPIGFTVDLYGTLHSNLFVNTNGSVTFGAPLASNTPFNLTATSWKIIAPFFADVDTRAGGVVTYGRGTVDGHAAFEVNWSNVGYGSQHADKTNAFQLFLVNRSDTGMSGNFDIQFRYTSLKWDSGDAGGGTGGVGGTAARVGFSAGTGVPGTYFEMPGSGLSGAFLDGAPISLARRSLDSATAGTYVFQVRHICYMPEPGCLALAVIGVGSVLAYGWKRRGRRAE